jgi:4-hydroxy-tetrahydrodipicolinate reductase
VRLGVFGRGRLGTAIATAARALGHDVVFAIGRDGEPKGAIDVAIDASAGAAALEHARFCAERGVDFVVGATGFDRAPLGAIVEKKIGVVVAPNFSVTVALLIRFAGVLARFAASRERYDPWIFEKHRPTKRDAPSGTALRTAEAMLRACPRKTAWRLADDRGPYLPHELAIGALRAGAGAGELAFGLDAPEETVEVRHEARGPSAYAEGALAAAAFVRGKKGIFDMDDVAREILDSAFAREGGS